MSNYLPTDFIYYVYKHTDPRYRALNGQTKNIGEEYGS